MTRFLIDGSPLVDRSTSWDNDQAPCLECGTPAGETCTDQCPAAIAAELAEEHDLQVEAAHDRSAA